MNKLVKRWKTIKDFAITYRGVLTIGSAMAADRMHPYVTNKFNYDEYIEFMDSLSNEAFAANWINCLYNDLGYEVICKAKKEKNPYLLYEIYGEDFVKELKERL